jgi:Cft2 family RNA processing exonuclease
MAQNYTTFSDNSASFEQFSCYCYGVGHDLEGVSLLVTLGSYRILLDCGLIDLEPIKQELPPHWLFCSHAHKDHSRGLSAFHQAFPDIPIYASKVTSQLLSLSNICHALQWRSPVSLADNLTVELFSAGHLPGAACFLFTYQTEKRSYRLLYTGDFAISSFQLVEGLSIENLRGLTPDVLIIEGSYGTAQLPHRRQQEKQLMAKIAQAIAMQKNILLPVSSLGSSQEILKLLRSHHQFTGKKLDIWVENTIAKNCHLYLEILDQLPISVQNFAKHQALFWDEKIYPRMSEIESPETLQLAPDYPCIILADYNSNFINYCEKQDRSWLILIPQYHHVFSQNNQKNDPLLTLSKLPNVSIETYILAEHSDGKNTTQLIHNLRPQHIIFIHGSTENLAELTNLEELQNRYQLHSPQNNSLVELPIAEKFIQSASNIPQNNYNYEGELNDIGGSINLSLPPNITQDPRWNKFADTGLIEVRWQGEELVLRGISQRELLNQKINPKLLNNLDCCGNCRYQINQRCLNSASPLYGFKINHDGYCPVFEPLDH